MGLPDAPTFLKRQFADVGWRTRVFLIELRGRFGHTHHRVLSGQIREPLERSQARHKAIFASTRDHELRQTAVADEVAV
jgi:hypothetical protein